MKASGRKREGPDPDVSSRSYLRGPSLQQPQLAVIQSRGEGKHGRQLQVGGHQAGDGVSGVGAAQRHVDAAQRGLHWNREGQSPTTIRHLPSYSHLLNHIKQLWFWSYSLFRAR